MYKNKFPVFQWLILSILLFSLATFGLPQTAYGEPLKSTQMDQGELLSYNATDGESYKDVDGIHPIISLTDGNISEVWDNVPSISVPSYGERGSISSVYGANDIYFLIVHDPLITWVATQFDSDFTGDPEISDNAVIPMERDDDIWVFGQTKVTFVLGDSYSAGQATEPYIYHDLQDDLSWERLQHTDENGEYVAIEVKRELNTNDLEGRDAIFTPESNLTMMMASSAFHNFEFRITKMKLVLSDIIVDIDTPIILVPKPNTNFLEGENYIFLNLQTGLIVGVTIQSFLIMILFIRSRRLK